MRLFLGVQTLELIKDYLDQLKSLIVSFITLIPQRSLTFLNAIYVKATNSRTRLVISRHGSSRARYLIV